MFDGHPNVQRLGSIQIGEDEVVPRIADLPQMEEWVAAEVPEVKAVTAHGQMPERALEGVMSHFLDGRAEPDTTFVDLHRRSDLSGRPGAMDQIFPHELLHLGHGFAQPRFAQVVAAVAELAENVAEAGRVGTARDEDGDVASGRDQVALADPPPHHRHGSEVECGGGDPDCPVNELTHLARSASQRLCHGAPATPA